MRYLVCALFLTVAGASYGQQQPSVAAQREAMKKLDFLVGRWSGDASVTRGPGDPLRLTQTETVAFKMDGLVLLVEGAGRNAEGKIVFQALATASYDDATSTYRFRAYSDGRYLDTELKVTSNGFEWGYSAGPLKVANVMKVDQNGEWVEFTESTYGATPPRRSVEMTLRRLPAPVPDNQLTAGEKAAGWRLLFDGKTFDGWEDSAKKTPPGDGFAIEDGCLKSLPRPKISEDLFTLDTFQDFEMEFDWRIASGGNSGVKYRIQDRVMLADGKPGQKFEDRVNASIKDRRTDRPARGEEYVIGFEYQVLDNAKNPDARRGANHQAGALYDMLAPLNDVTKPVGEFNHSRLVVKGEAIEHWLNGVKVVDGSLTAPAVANGTGARWGTDSPVYELLVKHPKKECQISLQNHSSEAWFKNIKIRKL
jgi:hypothetical protein